jgi:hypothetical protein
MYLASRRHYEVTVAGSDPRYVELATKAKPVGCDGWVRWPCSSVSSHRGCLLWFVVGDQYSNCRMVTRGSFPLHWEHAACPLGGGWLWVRPEGKGLWRLWQWICWGASFWGECQIDWGGVGNATRVRVQGSGRECGSGG